ncbi:MAG: 1-deoxy-D-xylulose-5-phosphate reductoisomerase [candidate division Zixibacteria bacterium]
MQARKIVILGSTGSIGKSTLDVIVAHPGRFEVQALAAFSNVELLVEQFHRFHPKYLCIVDETCKAQLTTLLSDQPVEVLSGEKELLGLASLSGIDLVVNAIVGSAGLLASLETLKAGIDLALANKESLVTGGPLFRQYLDKKNVNLLPIDSEHSAVWQALACGRPEEIRRIILTASGGPFRDLPVEDFEKITVEQALDHPTWQMGRKITIDSATLANKGLEVIEAVQLFQISPDDVSVVIHPQSIVHSMVEYVDSSIIAQMSAPDMRLPISYALFWPERVKSDFGKLDFSQVAALTFDKPDFDKFPALKLAFEVANSGGTAPAVYNAANEVAVDAFLKNTIRFIDIADTIYRTVEQMAIISVPTLEDILAADSEARDLAANCMEKTTS